MDFFGSQDTTILWYKYASEGSLSETVFVKFKISNNFKKTPMKYIQNNHKSIGKYISAYGF
jgi:hypothetical protein